MAASRWLDWIAAAGCDLWQVLPLGPTGFGDSPYQCFSAFAGNPLLVSLDLLVEEGLLGPDEVGALSAGQPDRVDFGQVITDRERLLSAASSRFRSGASPHLQDAYAGFCEQHADWLSDFAVFMALKHAHQGRPWWEWSSELAARDSGALSRAAFDLGSAIEDHRFRQFLFSRQWARVRQQAAERGIRIIGDIPIFVAHDSADVWAHPELFHLNADGRPTVVAGVPPDYFSPTGQRWGNPLYRWEMLSRDGYRWWIRRVEVVLQMVDLVRLDHFRGFEAYWEIPADAPTAQAGRWVPGPGAEFLESLRSALGSLPILAEDLGKITPGVLALRDGFGLPGMRILQFGLEAGPEDEFLPHNYPIRCVAYTGTHDNDTSRGWYEAAPEPVRDFCRRYLKTDGNDIAWDMIRAVWSSVAERAIAPLQDVLSLGGPARMNYPSRSEGNWAWRCPPGALTEELNGRLRELNFLYARGSSGVSGPEPVNGSTD